MNKTVQEIVLSLEAGINIGNTFDAHGITWIEDPSVEEMEVAWQKGEKSRAVTLEYIQSLVAAGFKSVRLCATWYKAAEPISYKIQEEWFTRIIEVIDWCIHENDMFVILNSHHDESLFSLYNSNLRQAASIVEKLWTQIGNMFSHYDERLIFEGLNEPRSRNSKFEWSGGSAEERESLNKLNQTFVTAVRKTLGNNQDRVLIIPTYAASSRGFEGFRVPSDSAESRIILSIHSYVPNTFCLGTHDNITGVTNVWDEKDNKSTDEITFTLKRIAKQARKLGIPVILGEWGSRNKNNTRARAKHAKFYVKTATKLGIPTFWWDDGMVENEDTPTEYMGLFNKKTRKSQFPSIVKTIVDTTRNTEIEVVEEDSEVEINRTSGVAVQLMAREAIDWKTELLPMTSEVLMISGDGEYSLTVEVKGYPRLSGLIIQSESGHFENPNMFENSAKVDGSWCDTWVTVISVKADGKELLGKEMTCELIGRGYEPIEGFAYIPLWNSWVESDQRLQDAIRIKQPGSQVSGNDFARDDNVPIDEITVRFKVWNCPTEPTEPTEP
jgi:endoglucanase